MSEEIERRLSDAFTAQAYGSVGDQAPIPPLQLNRSAAPRRHRAVRVLAPLLAAAVVAAVAVGITVHANTEPAHHVAGPVNGGSTSPAPSTGTASTHATLVSTVHVKLAMQQGEQVGVGMPVVAYFSEPVTDGRQLQKLTQVTVNGKPVTADWYFAPNTGMAGYPVQAHLRMEAYWPAHSVITVSAPVAGLPAGAGRTFASDLDLHFTTGASMVATVLAAKHELLVTEDGKDMGSFPVSLGASTTPTKSGIKVVMAKRPTMCLSGPGYNTCDVQYTQRLTDDGEYLLAAPWNTKNITSGINSSNGCTNLMPAAAEKLYSMMEVGDVVDFRSVSGPSMNFGDGIDDWNVPWRTWLTGGTVPTH